jgi:hypothetical protein
VINIVSSGVLVIKVLKAKVSGSENGDVFGQTSSHGLVAPSSEIINVLIKNFEAL